MGTGHTGTTERAPDMLITFLLHAVSWHYNIAVIILERQVAYLVVQDGIDEEERESITKVDQQV